MLEVKGLNIESLPFGKLVLFKEILSFQYEPLLLHYTDEFGNDVISYWVDLDENYSRWLLGKITKNELFMYLSGNKSLRELFANISSDYLFLVDYGLENESSIKSVKLITPRSIPDKYYPKENSYYLLGLSDVYKKYLNNYLYKPFTQNPDPIEAIKFKMEQLHLTPKDLAAYFGGIKEVSEVLNRKKPLTLKMIKALYKNLHIPAEVLLS